MDFMLLIPFLGVSVPESLVLYYMALILAGKRKSFAFLIALSLLTSLFSYTIRSLPIIFGVHTFLQIILMVIFVHLFFRVPWSLAIIIQVLASIILGLTEGVSVPLLARVFSYKLEDIISDPLLRIIFTLPHLALLVGVTHATAKRGWRIPLLELMMIKWRSHMHFVSQSYLFILCLIQVLMLVLLNISFYIYAAAVYPSFNLAALVTTCSVVIISSVFATLSLAGYTLKLAKREARLEAELLHIKEMHNLNLKMQVQRHDFYNHLTAVYGYLNAKRYNQAEEYIGTLYNNVRQIANLLSINPPELGALISVKQENAKSRGIDFSWQVNIQNCVLPLPPQDLTQITGNLLDNAFDAATSGRYPKVDLVITGNKMGLQIKVSNTGAVVPEDVRDHIFDAGYTTKDVSSHSGLGLFIIKRIVGRYNGQLILTKPENYPGVQFVIYIPWNN
ncbi:sensor histidine kinase [Desulfoscipio gibsoniae]|uniref:histidine kinase n=1 Tax=Desulfoscipio gibsoniae DSM 7213 TaxID=767817 RepID=R4KP90_9FIRM|nr:ATP-binding protein [Desulfoscipio gibsoniae]AGL02395.1 histidine kinase [Desulfoscipio gibsoniae DSM 7213]